MPDSGLIFPPAFKISTDAMAPVAGGTIEVYAAGTSTPLAVYSDQALTTSIGTAVYLDSAGHPVASSGSSTRITVYTGTALVKLVFKDADGATLGTYDNLKLAQASGAGAGSGLWEVPNSEIADTTYIVDSDDYGEMGIFDTTGGNVVVTLPIATSADVGTTYTVQKNGATNTLSVIAAGGTTVAGGVTYSVASNGDTATFVCNGADDWALLSFARPSFAQGAITSELLDARIVGGLAAVGDIKVISHATIPDGWLVCDGTAVSRDTYADLFDVIGETWGEGDNSTTFNLPNFDGRVMRFITPASTTGDPDAVPVAITGAANNGSGLIRLTMSSTAKFSTGMQASVYGVGGVTNANSNWTVTVISSTTLDLQGSTFSGTYTSGGFITNRHALYSGGNVGQNVGSYQDDAVQLHNHGYFGGTTDQAAVGSGNTLNEYISNSTGTSGPTGRFGTETRMKNANVIAIIMADPAAAGGAADIVHTIHSSAGAPSDAVGINNDYCVDYTNSVIYGPKTAGSWTGTGTSMIGPTGSTGATGATGATGPNTGLDFAWSTATSGDPGSGRVLANHATLASATAFHISKTGRNGEALGPVLATWDDSTSTHKGHLRVFTVADRTEYSEAEVTGITDDTTHYTVAVTMTAAAGTPSANDVMAVMFERTGNVGDAGSIGADGDPGISGGSVTVTPSYANAGGTGDRTALITVTTSPGLVSVGTADNLLDGGTGDNTTDSLLLATITVDSSRWFLFDFGAGAQKVITEVTWRQANTSTRGVWMWQGSNDANTFVDIGATFTLGGAAVQTQNTMSANETGYRYYRLLGVSGTASAGGYAKEIEFKIGSTILDGRGLVPAGGTVRQALVKSSSVDFATTWANQAGDVWAGLPSNIDNLWAFDELSGTAVANKIGTAALTLVGTGTPTYTWTRRGLKINNGCVEAPPLAVRTIIMAYRVKRDDPGYKLTGGGGAGSGSLGNGLTMAWTAHFAGGWGVHPLVRRALNGTNAHEVVRGGTGVLFGEFSSIVTNQFGIGGSYGLTTNRCAEIEVFAVATSQAQLTSDERTQVWNVMRRALIPRGVYLAHDDCPQQTDGVIIFGESNPNGEALLTSFSAGDQALTFSDVEIQVANSQTLVNNMARPRRLVLGYNQRLTDVTRAGFELGLAKRWRTNFLTRLRPLTILKSAQGSTRMAPPGVGSAADHNSWSPTAETKNSLYHTALLRPLYDLEQSLRERGIGLRLSGIVYNIGLNDAQSVTNTTDAATYQGYIQTFYDALKADTGIADLYGVMLRVHAYSPASDATALGHVRTAQADFVTANSTRWVLVDTDAYTRKGADPAHYDATGTNACGEAGYDQLNTLGRFA